MNAVSRTRVKNDVNSKRLGIYLLVVLLLTGLIVYRLFDITYLKHSFYSLSAEANSLNISNLLARGNIYFQNGKLSGSDDCSECLAATNRKMPTAYVVPADVPEDKKSELAGTLASILGLEAEKVYQTMDSESEAQRSLLKRLTPEQVNKINTLNIKGVGIITENDRFYPGGKLAADVLGFLGYVGNERSGQYGVESYYNDELFGTKWGVSRSLGGGVLAKIISLFKTGEEEKPADDKIDRPTDVVLTIDKNIQKVVEEKLDALMEKWKASAGMIIVQDPNTGKILAMADRPTFDPNKYSESDPINYLNRNMQEMYEPGSSFKPLTMAMGLNEGVVTPQTTFEDVGYREIAGFKIGNFSGRVFGVQTLTQMLEKSINTGAMFVQEKVGDSKFLDYVVDFGFGQKTGIDLPGEVGGDISNLYSGRKINFLTASFGQGIAVTPLQMINAYSAIANGGKLMRPYIVEKIVRGGGVVEVTEPKIEAIPIKEKTAAQLRSMLTSVVDNGFDKARVAGYDVAGKTGTAQIASSAGGYVEGEFIHNFLGFAPSFNPKFTILIRIDRPQGITFAADSLSPAFGELTQFLLNYYSIPPTR